MRKTLLASFVAVVLWIAGSGAHAATTFNNFGPNFTYDTNLGFVVGVDGFGMNTVGALFTAEQTGFFSTLFVAANARVNTPNDGLTYSLRADVGGRPNGLLESIVFNDVCFDVQCPDGELLIGGASGTTLLTAGTQYWLVATATNPDSGFFWFASLPGNAGTIFIQNLLFPDGAVFPFDQLPVFRIDVVPVGAQVPEPSQLALVLCALLLVYLLSQRVISVIDPKVRNVG